VNATRANVGRGGGNGGDGGGPCRIAAKRLTLTGGADPMGARFPGAVAGGLH